MVLVCALVGAVSVHRRWLELASNLRAGATRTTTVLTVFVASVVWSRTACLASTALAARITHVGPQPRSFTPRLVLRVTHSPRRHGGSGGCLRLRLAVSRRTSIRGNHEQDLAVMSNLVTLSPRCLAVPVELSLSCSCGASPGTTHGASCSAIAVARGSAGYGHIATPAQWVAA